MTGNNNRVNRESHHITTGYSATLHQSEQSLSERNFSVKNSDHNTLAQEEELFGKSNYVLIDHVEFVNDIKVLYDVEDNVLSYQTIVQILDKRQAVSGIKLLKKEFKIKRRQCLEKQKYESYKKIVLLYKQKLES